MPSPQSERYCAFCGRLFRLSHGNRRYCDAVCAHHAGRGLCYDESIQSEVLARENERLRRDATDLHRQIACRRQLERETAGWEPRPETVLAWNQIVGFVP